MESIKINESIEVVDQAIKHHLSLIKSFQETDCDYRALESSDTIKKYNIFKSTDKNFGGVIQLRKLGASRTELSLIIPTKIAMRQGATEDETNKAIEEVQSGLEFVITIIKLLTSKMAEDGFTIIKGDTIVNRQSNNVDSNFTFVNPERLGQLQKVHSENFDLSKLIQLRKELNDSYRSENYFSVAMLARAILDHVPPIFGFSKFEQVIGQHGNKSFKGVMEHLDKSLRNIADSFLHFQIRKQEVLPNQNQVNFSADLDVLLSSQSKEFIKRIVVIARRALFLTKQSPRAVWDCFAATNAARKDGILITYDRLLSRNCKNPQITKLYLEFPFKSITCCGDRFGKPSCTLCGSME